jgi:hypothetical protein
MCPRTQQAFQQEMFERMWKSRDWTVVIDVTGLSSVTPESSEAVLATFVVQSVTLSASGPVLLQGRFCELFKLEGRVPLSTTIMSSSGMSIESHNLHRDPVAAAAAYNAACQAAGGDHAAVVRSLLRLKLRGNVLGRLDALEDLRDVVPQVWCIQKVQPCQGRGWRSKQQLSPPFLL